MTHSSDTFINYIGFIVDKKEVDRCESGIEGGKQFFYSGERRIWLNNGNITDIKGKFGVFQNNILKFGASATQKGVEVGD